MLKNCKRYILAANLKSFGFFMIEGWVLQMVFKMWRKTSTLQNFVDNSTCNTLRAPEGLAASGARCQGVLGWWWQGLAATACPTPSLAGRPGTLEQPQSKALVPPWGQGPGDRDTPPQPGWHILTNLTLGKSQTKQLTLTIIHKSSHRMYM